MADRLRLRRFGSLGWEDLVPDATTLSRLRIDLAKAGLAEAGFDVPNAQFEKLFGTMKRRYLDRRVR